MSSGRTSAVAFSTAPKAARLATLPFSFVNVGIFDSQPGMRLPDQRRVSSFASSGCAAAYAFHFSFHSACCFAPRSLVFLQCASASLGTKKGSRLGQP